MTILRILSQRRKHETNELQQMEEIFGKENE